jgi:hypothetical protein
MGWEGKQPPPLPPSYMLSKASRVCVWRSPRQDFQCSAGLRRRRARDPASSHMDVQSGRRPTSRPSPPTSSSKQGTPYGEHFRIFLRLPNPHRCEFHHVPFSCPNHPTFAPSFPIQFRQPCKRLCVGRKASVSVTGATYGRLYTGAGKHMRGVSSDIRRDVLCLRP